MLFQSYDHRCTVTFFWFSGSQCISAMYCLASFIPRMNCGEQNGHIILTISHAFFRMTTHLESRENQEKSENSKLVRGSQAKWKKSKVRELKMLHDLGQISSFQADDAKANSVKVMQHSSVLTVTCYAMSLLISKRNGL